MCDGYILSSVTNTSGNFGFTPKGGWESLINLDLERNDNDLLKKGEIVSPISVSKVLTQ